MRWTTDIPTKPGNWIYSRENYGTSVWFDVFVDYHGIIVSKRYNQPVDDLKKSLGINMWFGPIPKPPVSTSNDDLRVSKEENLRGKGPYGGQ